MAIRIMDDTMALEIGNCVVATARFSEHAAADGNGAWIVSTHPARLFSRNQAITALTLCVRDTTGTLSDSELLSMIIVLLIARRETSSTLITNAVCALLQHPAQLAALCGSPSGRQPKRSLRDDPSPPGRPGQIQ
jgi:cytochrome P450